MKFRSTVCFSKALLVLAGLSVCSTALAQPSSAVRRCEQPKSSLTYTVKISGQHLDEAKRLGLEFHRSSSSAPPPDQARSGTTIAGSASSGTIPGTFEVTVTIPEFVVEGEYKVAAATVSNDYVSQPIDASGFAVPPITVCEPKGFGPYKLDSVTKNH